MRRIICTADICFGKPRIENTRVYVTLLAGLTREQAAENWPWLNLTDKEWAEIQAWLDSAEGRRQVAAAQEEEK